MWDALTEGMTVNYCSAHDNMNVDVTVSHFNGATYRWDAEVGAWYATRITNMDEVMRAYVDRCDGVSDVCLAAETERVYA
jgi:hypothetical protein